MKVTATKNIDVFELFIHDRSNCEPFCGYSLARSLTNWLNDHITGASAEIKCPEECGLDRMVLTYEKYGDEPTIFNSRYYDVADVRSNLPKDVVTAFDKLNTENVLIG